MTAPSFTVSTLPVPPAVVIGTVWVAALCLGVEETGLEEEGDV